MSRYPNQPQQRRSWSPDQVAGPPPAPQLRPAETSAAMKLFAAIGVIAAIWIVILIGYALLTEWFALDLFGVHMDCLRDPIFGGAWCRATGS